MNKQYLKEAVTYCSNDGLTIITERADSAIRAYAADTRDGCIFIPVKLKIECNVLPDCAFITKAI